MLLSLRLRVVTVVKVGKNRKQPKNSEFVLESDAQEFLKIDSEFSPSYFVFRGIHRLVSILSADHAKVSAIFFDLISIRAWILWTWNIVDFLGLHETCVFIQTEATVRKSWNSTKLLSFWFLKKCILCFRQRLSLRWSTAPTKKSASRPKSWSTLIFTRRMSRPHTTYNAVTDAHSDRFRRIIQDITGSITIGAQMYDFVKNYN